MPNFATRSLDKLMVLDYDWFCEQTGFHFFDKLANLYLIDFMKFKGPYYEEPIKAFYTNLTFLEDVGLLISEVKGVKIEITLEEFGNIVNLPTDRDICLDFKPSKHWTDFEYDKVVDSFKHLEVGFTKPVLVQSLTV